MMLYENLLGIEFNIAYPGCSVSNPETVGNDYCDSENNIRPCKFDGGDCCPVIDDTKHLGDGKCHAGHFFTEQCEYDSGDCDQLREDYPNCPDLQEFLEDKNGSPTSFHFSFISSNFCRSSSLSVLSRPKQVGLEVQIMNLQIPNLGQ